jgi:hypothetical protein
MDRLRTWTGSTWLPTVLDTVWLDIRISHTTLLFYSWLPTFSFQAGDSAPRSCTFTKAHYPSLIVGYVGSLVTWLYTAGLFPDYFTHARFTRLVCSHTTTLVWLVGCRGGCLGSLLTPGRSHPRSVSGCSFTISLVTYYLRVRLRCPGLLRAWAFGGSALAAPLPAGLLPFLGGLWTWFLFANILPVRFVRFIRTVPTAVGRVLDGSVPIGH